MGSLGKGSGTATTKDDARNGEGGDGDDGGGDEDSG